MFFLGILYFAVFFACYGLLVRYAFRGKSGMLFLRRRAEESGDYERVKRLHFLDVAVKLISLLAVGVLPFCVILVMKVADGLNLLFILLAVFGVYFLPATAIRLRIRRMMLRAEESGEEPPLPEEFRVSYTVNPRRINNLMLWVIFLVWLLAFAIMAVAFRSRYDSPVPGTVFGVLFLIIIAVLLKEVFKEHRNVKDLIVLDRKGIRDENPINPAGFIPWQEVRNVSVACKGIRLTLNRTVKDDPGRPEVIDISLSRTPISDDTVREKVEQYRLAAGQTEQPEE